MGLVMPTVYLAGKFALKEKIAAVSKYLENYGYTTTTKWWEIEQKPARIRTFEEHRVVGEAEIKGILDADLVVGFLTDPTYAYRGTLAELGIAIGSRIKTGEPAVVIAVPEGGTSANIDALCVPHIYVGARWVELKSEEWGPELVRLLGLESVE